jgi:hypothetical protein
VALADGQRHELATHLAHQLEAARHQLHQRVAERRVGQLARGRRRRDARALEAHLELLQPMRHAQRVAAQLVDVVAVDLQRSVLRRAAQPREDLQVLPHVVAGKERRRDLDREVHLVAPLAARRQHYAGRPLDARQVMDP